MVYSLPVSFLLCGDADYYDNCAVGIWRRCHALCVLSADCHCFTIPSMLPFYRQGQALAGIAKQPLGISRERICHALFAAGIMACLGISLNNLISMTKLTEISMGYQQANTDFYGSTMGMEILCLAVFTPMLEELVFRGIIFGRLKDMLSKPFAVGISALILRPCMSISCSLFTH